jgi:hypothetical protein
MPAGVWSKLGRWRAFADAVALVLGINVWVSVVLLPGLFIGAWGSATMLFAGLLALPVLALGIWRRSELVLLLGFPFALLVPVAFAPEMASPFVYGPVRFTIVAIGVVGYLMGASFFTSFHEPPPPRSVRPLSSSRKPVPQRWRRRFRVYRFLTLLSLAFPIVLLYVVNFNDTNQAFMRNMFPGRVAAMTTFLSLLVIGLWLALYAHVFLGIFKPHRTGDRDLVAGLEQLRAQARRGRPRPSFYLAVAVALAFMIILLLSRYY